MATVQEQNGWIWSLASWPCYSRGQLADTGNGYAYPIGSKAFRPRRRIGNRNGWL